MSSVALFRDTTLRDLQGEKISKRRNSGGGIRGRNGSGENKGSKNKNDTKAKKFFLVLVLFLFFVLVLEFVFHLFVAPRLMIDSVTIETRGEFRLSNEEIMSAAGLREESYFFSVRTSELRSKLQSLPMVESASVSKHFPNSLSIRLVKRSPVALLTVSVDGKLSTAKVDEEGVVYGIRRGGGGSLPVISGVEIPKVEAGMELPDVLTSFLEDLEKLQSDSPTHYRLISEVKFVKNNGAEYEVILFPSHYRVRVRIGPSIDKELLSYIMLVLDVLSQREMEEEVVEVDFRTDNVVYRVEGD